MGFTLPDIAKAGHVDAVGPVADRIPIGGTVDSTVCSAAHDVIHQVLPDLAARVGDSREQEDARGLDRRGTEEDDPRFELERVLGLRIDHAHTGGAPAAAVEGDAVHHAVRTQGQSARGLRRRQRGVDAREVGARDAAAVTGPAVVTRGASVVRFG